MSKKPKLCLTDEVVTATGHIDFMIDKDEQGRIGVSDYDKNQKRDLQLRVLRLCDAYNNLTADICEAKNLLAVMHRDGGEKTHEIGFRESCILARKVVSDLRVKLDEYGEEAQ